MRNGELPEEWGLIVQLPNGALRAKKKAPTLTPEPLPYMMLAPLLRAANFAGRFEGRGELVPYVPARPCSRCDAEITARADGKWEHVTTGRTRCTFPAGHHLKPYESDRNYRMEARP